MIIWLASYPKSGNTWLRAMLASYFYTQNGEFSFDVLDNIGQFPSFAHFKNYGDKFKKPESTSKYWIDVQRNINKDKKLKFLKTHSALCKIDNNIFTDKENTLGAIYIIRDPRNVISSISNHYDYNIKEALDFMKDEKRCLLDKEDERYLGFVPLFSWISHQKSWIKNKRFKVLTIKYEDLGSQTFKVFKEVIDFISSISNMKNAFNREKAKKVIQSCDFGKMQKLEKEKGFPEAVMKKNEDKKIKFFNLGPNNDYKNLLDKGILEEMNTIYKDQLEEFKYETKY